MYILGYLIALRTTVSEAFVKVSELHLEAAGQNHLWTLKGGRRSTGSVPCLASTQSAQLSRSHKGHRHATILAVEEGYPTQQQQHSCHVKSEVQEDEVDQMHKEASLKPHSGWLFYRIGTKGTSSM